MQVLEMLSAAIRAKPRKPKKILPRFVRDHPVIHSNEELNPIRHKNWDLIKEIHDFYMAAHNFPAEQVELLMQLKEGGFDIEKLQDQGILRFVTQREGFYRMPQNALLNLKPKDTVGTLIECNGSRYEIIGYSNGCVNPTVQVMRYERTWLGFGDYRQRGMSIGPLFQAPKNGLELVAFVLEREGEFKTMSEISSKV